MYRLHARSALLSVTCSGCHHDQARCFSVFFNVAGSACRCKGKYTCLVIWSHTSVHLIQPIVKSSRLSFIFFIQVFPSPEEKRGLSRIKCDFVADLRDAVLVHLLANCGARLKSTRHRWVKINDVRIEGFENIQVSIASCY